MKMQTVETDLSAMPGYSQCDYLLVLQPHEALWNSIIDIKKEFAQKYDCPLAHWMQPNITIARFLQYEMMEPRIVNCLKQIAVSMAAFKVELKDFGSFPSHTIFINVTSKLAVMNIVKAIKPAQSLLKMNKDNKPHFIIEPHLFLVRKLLPWQYEKSWLEYEHRNFTGRFIADKMRLLKRIPGEKQRFLTVADFKFENLAVITKQGELF